MAALVSEAVKPETRTKSLTGRFVRSGFWSGSADKEVKRGSRGLAKRPERGRDDGAERKDGVMAGSVNKVILVGNLGRDPEIRRTQDGRPIANLRIATTETWRDRNSGRPQQIIHRFTGRIEGGATATKSYRQVVGF